MLDIGFFSPIIYIWYEGGELKPPLVRLTFQPPTSAPGTIRSGAAGAQRRRTAVCRVSAPSGSHRATTGSPAPRHTRMKGGIRHHGKEGQEGGEEGGEEALGFSRTKKRGRQSPPFQLLPATGGAHPSRSPSSAFRPRPARAGSHPIARCGPPRPCPRSRVRTRCSARPAAAAAHA